MARTAGNAVGWHGGCEDAAGGEAHGGQGDGEGDSGGGGLAGSDDGKNYGGEAFVLLMGAGRGCGFSGEDGEEGAGSFDTCGGVGCQEGGG